MQMQGALGVSRAMQILEKAKRTKRSSTGSLSILLEYMIRNGEDGQIFVRILAPSIAIGMSMQPKSSAKAPFM